MTTHCAWMCHELAVVQTLILGVYFVILFCRWNDKIAKLRQCNTCFIAEVNLVMSAETSRCLHNVLSVVWDFNLKFSILSRSLTLASSISTRTNWHKLIPKQLTLLSWCYVILYYLVHTPKSWEEITCDIGSFWYITYFLSILMCSFLQVLELSRNLLQLWLSLTQGFYDIEPYFSFNLTYSSQGYRQG